jgi:magnesium transporter
MNHDPDKILTESIKRLLRRNAVSNLRKIVNRTHGADLSRIFRALTLRQQHMLFDMIEDTEEMKLDDIVGVLESMPSDDVADILGKLPEKKANAILKKMKKEGSEEIEGLLSYEADTAGGIMLPDFIAMSEDTTAGQAIGSLQKEYMDVEMPFYLYVVDEYGKLVGVSSLRQLVVVSPDTPLKDFMSTDIFSVQTDTDQEEVAKLVARYDILAVPVVNDTNELVGIVTVDDVIDIIREEATEDILKMAGAGGEFVETQSVFKSMRIRLPWLFASCIGGIVAFLVISRFEGSLNRYVYLAAFIPVIMGMALSVGLAVFCSMSLAALVGSLIPMLFARVNIDPAVATGPFVTTAMDIISVFLYFQIATTLLGI